MTHVFPKFSRDFQFRSPKFQFRSPKTFVSLCNGLRDFFGYSCSTRFLATGSLTPKYSSSTTSGLCMSKSVNSSNSESVGIVSFKTAVPIQMIIWVSFTVGFPIVAASQKQYQQVLTTRTPMSVVRNRAVEYIRNRGLIPQTPPQCCVAIWFALTFRRFETRRHSAKHNAHKMLCKTRLLVTDSLRPKNYGGAFAGVAEVVSRTSGTRMHGTKQWNDDRLALSLVSPETLQIKTHQNDM
jgi:hypothetical protein